MDGYVYADIATLESLVRRIKECCLYIKENGNLFYDKVYNLEWSDAIAVETSNIYRNVITTIENLLKNCDSISNILYEQINILKKYNDLKI